MLSSLEIFDACWRHPAILHVKTIWIGPGGTVTKGSSFRGAFLLNGGETPPYILA